jgi:hypothetical protein
MKPGINGSHADKSVDREQVEAKDTQRDLDLDLVRSEPVEPLAAVEEELQCSDAEPSVAKPSQSSRPANGRSARRPRNSSRARISRRRARWRRTPSASCMNPWASRRGSGRGSDEPEHRHRLTLLLGRIGVEQYGLRQRHQRRAEDALEQTEDHDLAERYRGATQHRSHDETDDRRQELRLATDLASSQPVAGVIIAAATI